MDTIGGSILIVVILMSAFMIANVIDVASRRIADAIEKAGK